MKRDLDCDKRSVALLPGWASHQSPPFYRRLTKETMRMQGAALLGLWALVLSPKMLNGLYRRLVKCRNANGALKQTQPVLPMPTNITLNPKPPHSIATWKCRNRNLSSCKKPTAGSPALKNLAGDRVKTAGYWILGMRCRVVLETT